MSGRSFITGSALALCVLCAARGAGADEQPLSLGVAVSLRAVMPRLMESFRATSGGPELHADYDSSGNLRKKVEAGAPFDVVVLADMATIDALIAKDMVDRATRRVVATNTLVLIGPKGAKPITFATIDTLPVGEMLAIGEPGAVPAGRYAKEAFEKLGKWSALAGRIVFAGDVGAVLNYARRGEVAAAVVYRTEIRGIDDVVLLDQASGDWAPTPQVVAATVKGSHDVKRAMAFVEFLDSPPAQQIFRDLGFGAP